MIELRGQSVAGLQTCIEVPSLNLGLDVGSCSDTSLCLDHILISHGHTDHVGSIAIHAARRYLVHRQRGPATYYVPAAIEDGVRRLIEAAASLDDHEIPYNLVPMKEQVVQLSPSISIKAFPTIHTAPSCGYQIRQTRKRLRPEFRDLPKTEFGQKIREGVELNETFEAIPLVYTGDTMSDVYTNQRHILQSAECLITELTFIGGDVDVAKARHHGHVHLDEIRDLQDVLTNQHVVFTHLSPRYRRHEVRSLIEEKLDPRLLSRITLF